NVEDDGSPIELSGAPPDDFNPCGQFWGNPTYRWEVHESTEFEWWKKRMRIAASRTPGIRLDHFIGIAEYWAIPGQAQDATFGTWKKGPGSKLISAILGIADFVIAEDLGMAGDEAIRLRDKYGLHGMSILQFGWESETPPHHINCLPDRVVAYTGTHDNDTFRGWYSKLPANEREKVRKELGCSSSEVHKEAIKRLLHSRAEIVIIPLQDILGLGSSSRINTPGLVSRRNWSWVSPDDWISLVTGSWFSESVKTSGRLPWSND
ncbi:MAG: 4-alpha-glucanotransferase, partial [Candidatus Thermoplasmatota archaeon]|nr:4-alpha-glucanotransferase [Candidatus Thermoplasmatota archaeon]